MTLEYARVILANIEGAMLLHQWRADHVLQNWVRDRLPAVVVDLERVGENELYVAYLVEDGHAISAAAAVGKPVPDRPRDADWGDMLLEWECPIALLNCPRRILERLSKTNNENAIEWRRACWERVKAQETKDYGMVDDAYRIAQRFDESDHFRIAKDLNDILAYQEEPEGIRVAVGVVYRNGEVAEYDVRVYTLTDSSGPWVPTAQGCRVTPDILSAAVLEGPRMARRHSTPCGDGHSACLD